MTDERAVEQLEEFLVIDDWSAVYMPYLQDAIEYVINRINADKWNVIHTEADLPKESDWYLVTRVFNSKKYVATVFFNENTKSFYEDSCTPLNNITHWRPLPEVPESEDE